MKRFLVVALLLGLPGCVIYLDNPPLRSIFGRVLRADTGAPVSGAWLTFYSGRKPFSLLPVDTFGIDASATTDADGRFAVSAKLNDKVDAIAQNEEFVQKFSLPMFPASNHLDVVWKLFEKKPLPPPRRR